jgi:sporulation protein YlmC with PRC-barrel domain
MSARSISMSELLGRRVRDVEGRTIGRVEELNAEIELHANGNEYVVTSISVGRFGPLDIIASGSFVRQLVRRISRATGYARYRIPWDWMDLRDPSRPRVLRPERELRRDSL